MNDILSSLATSPTSYPQKFDLARNSICFLQMSPADYSAASFLDDRVLDPRRTADWIQFDLVQAAMKSKIAERPIHFIFHTGHVGSTLLSRLLDETGSVLGLREPLPLRTLATSHDQFGVSATSQTTMFNTRLETFLRLWSRGFEQTRAVVLKATSSAARIAPLLLSARPEAKATYLNVSAEIYLATLLAGENAKTDLNGFGLERALRLHAILGIEAPTIASLSLGELAAMSWLVETLTQKQLALAVGPRLLALDFDALLSNLEGTLARVLEHFSVAAPSGWLEGVARSPVLARYSKAPTQFAYSASLRRQLLNQARREHAGEIPKGLSYLADVSRRSALAARLLGP